MPPFNGLFSGSGSGSGSTNTNDSEEDDGFGLADVVQQGVDAAQDIGQRFAETVQEESQDNTQNQQGESGPLTDSPLDTGNARPPTGGPPGGSETIQGGPPGPTQPVDRQQTDTQSPQPTDQQQPTEEPPQPVDQQQSQGTEGGFARQPGSGIPGVSENIQSGQPRESASQPGQRPTSEEIANLNLNEVDPSRLSDLLGTETTGQRYSDPSADIPLDRQRRNTGSPVRPTNPNFDEEASLPQLASAISNPTIDLSTTGEARLAQLSPLRLRQLGLSGGEIRGISPAIDTSGDLSDPSLFRQTFSEEEAETYIENQEDLMDNRRGARLDADAGFYGGDSGDALTEAQQDQIESFREEAVQAYDEQFTDVDIGTGDVNIRREDGRLTPELRPGILRDIQVERREEAAQDIATRLSEATGGDISPDEVQFGPQGPQLTEEGQTDIEQAQREQAAAEFRQGALDENFSPTDLDQTARDSLAAIEQGRVTAEDFTFEDEALTLDEGIQEDIISAQFGIDPENIDVEDGQVRASESFLVERNEEARQTYTQAYQEFQQAQEDREAAIRGGVEQIEQQLEASLSSNQGFSTQGVNRAPQTETPDFDLTRSDVTVTDENQLVLTDSAEQRFEEAQEETARQRIDEQLPTDVGPEDITRQNGSFTLSEEGRQELREYQTEQAEEELLTALREETGADLEADDIRVSTTTNDEGETVFTAELTKSGEREFAGEQVPGSDLPWIGGTLERGGEEAAGVEQTFRGVGDWIERQVPTPDLPEVDLPDISSKEVAGAAAVGVAAPEPVTTGTGALVLGGIAAGSATVAAADELGLGQGAPQAGATTFFERSEIQVPEDGSVRGTTEIQVPGQVSGLGEFLPTEEQPTEGTVVPDQEILIGDQTRTQAEIQLPQSVFSEQVDPTRLVTGQLVGGQLIGGRTGEETEVEDDELGVPDDPWLESDRRLYDPTRTFGEQEDITTPVDPTTDESPSREDITGGIGGVGNPEPAREGAETFEESFRQYLEEKREQAERQEVYERQELLNTDDGEEESLLDELLGAQEAELVVTEPQALAEETSLLPQSDFDPLAGVFEPDTERTQTYAGELARERGAIDEATDGRARQTQPGQIPQTSQADLTEELIEEQLPTQQQIAEEQQTATEQQAASPTGSGYSYEFGQPTEYEYPTAEPVVDRPSYRTPPWLDLPDLDSDDSDDEFPLFAGSTERYEFDFLDPLSGEAGSSSDRESDPTLPGFEGFL